MLRCLTLAVLLMVAAPVTASANEWRDRQCRYNQGSETWTTSEVQQTIRCAASKWNVGVSKAMSVAECESHYYARAVNGQYRGVYQHSIYYWPDRVRSAPDRLDLATGVFNARSNVIVSILAARGGWGAWAGCA